MTGIDVCPTLGVACTTLRASSHVCRWGGCGVTIGWLAFHDLRSVPEYDILIPTLPRGLCGDKIGVHVSPQAIARWSLMNAPFSLPCVLCVFDVGRSISIKQRLVDVQYFGTACPSRASELQAIMVLRASGRCCLDRFTWLLCPTRSQNSKT
jgi:hypothetical protein